MEQGKRTPETEPATVRDIGEFGLIARIARDVAHYGSDVVAGIGDDTAAIRCSPDKLLLATCDVQVEGVHFLTEGTPPESLGRRALAVNVSDIASMGGVPRHALISLGLPTTTPVAFVDGLYAGLRSEAERFGVNIVGGNVSTSRGGIFIDITLLGEVEPELALYRHGARVGDLLIVTGSLGDAAGGLQLLLNPSLRIAAPSAFHLKRAHQQPRARVAEGRIIAASGQAHAMIDLSDGLASDLAHMAGASGVGAVVFANSVPVSPELRELGAAIGRDPLDLALFGGEDYELLASVAPEAAPMIAEDVKRATGTPLSVIGEIRPADERLRLQLASGGFEDLAPAGFRHF